MSWAYTTWVVMYGNGARTCGVAIAALPRRILQVRVVAPAAFFVAAAGTAVLPTVAQPVAPTLRLLTVAAVLVCALPVLLFKSDGAASAMRLSIAELRERIVGGCALGKAKKRRSRFDSNVNL